jgi:acetolactate synthase-1/2/3 large subunit
MLEASPSPMRVADMICDELSLAGVDTLFLLPGGAIGPLLDALLDRPDLRIIHVPHESSAMYAAAGYARASGRPVAVVVTSGPGLMNTMNGLASAYCEGLPIIVLAGEVSSAHQGRGALQDGSRHGFDVLAVTRTLSKHGVELSSARTASTKLRVALRRATAPRSGPVVVTIPVDVLAARALPTCLVEPPEVVAPLDPILLDAVVTELRRHPRTAMLAGNGCRS